MNTAMNTTIMNCVMNPVKNHISYIVMNTEYYHKYFWLRQELRKSLCVSVRPSVIMLNSSLCRKGKYFVLLC